MIKQKRSFLDKIVGVEKEVRQVDLENEPEKISVVEETDSEEVEVTPVEEEPATPEEVWDRAAAHSAEVEEEAEGQLAIDVYQTDDFIVIKSIIGGIKPEDLDLTVTNDMVTIKGSRENSEELISNDYYYQECFWGNFSRSVILPCDIRVDGVEASMKNGILTIKMPKVEKNTSMRIEVRGE